MSYWDNNVSEKRTGPDVLVKWIKISSYLVWLFIAVFIFLTDLAKPQQLTFFDRLLDISIRTTWDNQLLLVAFITAIILFILSFFSLVVNLKRLKRKSDHISLSLIISLILSSIFIVIYLITYFKAF